MAAATVNTALLPYVFLSFATANFLRQQGPLSQKDLQQVTPGPQGSTGSSKAGQRDRELGAARTETQKSRNRRG